MWLYSTVILGPLSHSTLCKWMIDFICWNCGGRHWLAHPPSQDILSSIHHNLMNIEPELRVKWKLQSSVGVWRDSVQQQASGRLQTLYVRGEVVLRAHTIVCVRVYCVCQEIHTYTTTNSLNLGKRVPDSHCIRLAVSFWVKWWRTGSKFCWIT
jgi:hypothetical protein